MALQNVVVVAGDNSAITAVLSSNGFPIAEATLTEVGFFFAGIWQGGANLASDVEIYPLDLAVTLRLLVDGSASASRLESGQLLLAGTIEQAPAAF